MHRRVIVAIIAIVAVGVLVTGCSSKKNSLDQQRQQAIQQRANSYAKAVSQVPTPNITNFPRRKTLADAVVRQSLPNHPWYVYVLGLNGNIEYYFVAKSVPVNDCDYLSSAQQINDQYEGPVVVDAPSLEGIYQSSSGCNTLTFFDLTTNAEVQLNASQAIILDRPIKVQAQAIKIQSSK